MNLESRYKKNYLNKFRIYKYLILIFLILIFLSICIGYYLGYELGQFPDEMAHAGYIFDVSRDGYPDFINGKILNFNKLNYLPHPPLYYLLVGYIYKILILIFDNISMWHLRFINTFISALTLIITFSAMRLLKIKLLAIFLSLSIFICIPMFTVLSISLNNDPLSILGCALVTYSLIGFSEKIKDQYIFVLFFIGCILTFLTKATGALTVVCIALSFFAFNFKEVNTFIADLNKRRLMVMALFISLITAFFLITYAYFGKLFPAPQGNPSDWWLLEHPNGSRMGLFEYWFIFYKSNLSSLTVPYGHVDFPDSSAREFTLDLLFFSLPYFFIYSIYKFSDKKKIIIRTLLSSFFIFIFIYFIVVRIMHLKTGYTGALQARYFFGFIPLIVICLGLSLDTISNRFLKLIYVVLIIFCICLSFYPAYIKYFQVNLFSDQKKYNLTLGELIPGRVFEQSFIAKNKRIKNVELFLGTYSRINHGDIKLDILEETTGKILASKSIPVIGLGDNSWIIFDIPATHLELGNRYSLRLTSENSKAGDAITWWAYAPNKQSTIFSESLYGPQNTSELDSFPQGYAKFNNKLLESTDFSFKINYVK